MNDVADPLRHDPETDTARRVVTSELKRRDPFDELLREMELLRVENGNLYVIVQGECQELRKKQFDARATLASENRELRERCRTPRRSCKPIIWRRSPVPIKIKAADSGRGFGGVRGRRWILSLKNCFAGTRRI